MSDATKDSVHHRKAQLRKAQLRKALRTVRQTLTALQQQDAAAHLPHTVRHLPEWASAETIALYMPADGEIGITPLARLARSTHKRVLLPIITSSNTLDFALWDTNDPLVKNRYNIPEPGASAQRYAVGEIDIIFLPMVGWDQNGARLGMGGGFYDRSLQQLNKGNPKVSKGNPKGPLLVGLAHSCQELDEIPTEHFDVVLHYIATEAGLIKCQPHR